MLAILLAPAYRQVRSPPQTKDDELDLHVMLPIRAVPSFVSTVSAHL